MLTLHSQNVAQPTFDEGDAGIILKKNGDFQIFNTHKSIDPNNLTPEQLAQGKRLIAAGLVMQHSHLLEMVLNAAAEAVPYGADNVVEFAKNS